jgi:hypothetical protein
MKITSKSLITFIGSKNFNISREFYRVLGFTESIIEPKMSIFSFGNDRSFYLQDAYVKDWIENTMLFWEVSDLKNVHAHIKSLDLVNKFAGVRVSEIRKDAWGDEFFVHDPAGVLWHIGEFK